MIASIEGVLERQGPGGVVINVAGIGLTVRVPHTVLERAPRIGERIYLFTYLAVREDALVLYGFSSMEERELFEMLLQVSGIGPSLALAGLSNLSVEVIRNAVSADQPEVLARVPGIGKKTAEKIVFHLKDKVGPPLDLIGQPKEGDTEVFSVLTTLGYSTTEAHAAIRSIPGEAPDDVEERLRYALQYFAVP